jgi:heme/copper-type cytochrome/quinol oxidase subunit 3
VFILTAGVALFVWNMLQQVVLGQGAVAPRNPWGAGTLDWATELPPPDDGYRRIPIVHSRYPLWDQPSLTRGDARTEALVEGLTHRPETWRATFVTSLLDAKPEGIVRLSEPSWWPLIAGGCLTLVFVGELADWYPLLGAAFAGYILASIVWLWPSKGEREIPEVDPDGTIHGLPVYLHGPMSPAWWAMVLIVTVFSVFLGCLVFSYFFLRTNTETWPPAGLPPPDLLLPGIATVVLLLSAAPILFAERSIRAGSQGRLVLGLAGGFGLGVLFLGLLIVDFARVPFTPGTNAYASAFFTLAGCHACLAAGGLVMFAVVQLQAWLGYFTRLRFLAVQTTAMFWYFVVVSWLVVLAVAYVSPYLV